MTAPDCAGHFVEKPQHDDLVAELLGTWTEPELRSLHATLRTLGVGGWLDWLQVHHADAAQHLATTPSRSKRPRAAPPAVDVLVRYGALWLAQLGRLVALELEHPGLHRGVGSPRETRAARGQLVVALSLMIVHPEPWLWDEPPDLGDPFE